VKLFKSKKEEKVEVPNGRFLTLAVEITFDKKNGERAELFRLDISEESPGPESEYGPDFSTKISFGKSFGRNWTETNIGRNTAVLLHKALTHALMTGKSFKEEL